MPSQPYKQANAVTVELQGGLGNQLFQYATGRAISLRHSCPLLLDTRWFGRQSVRRYDLDNFAHAGKIVEGRMASAMASIRFVRKLSNAYGKLAGHVLEDMEDGFDPRIMTASKGVYLRGYWQAPAYFVEFRPQILNELKWKHPAAGKNRQLLAEMSRHAYVGVHVRRGDYVANPQNLELFAQCLPDYYAHAVEALLARDPGQYRFIVFSNDLRWAKANLQLPGKTIFAEHNGGFAGQEDIRLMSACRHNIIANSTFSWWGAWLNPNPNKIVVAPKSWFVRPGYSNDFINPPDWIVVDNQQPAI